MCEIIFRSTKMKQNEKKKYRMYGLQSPKEKLNCLPLCVVELKHATDPTLLVLKGPPHT